MAEKIHGVYTNAFCVSRVKVDVRRHRPHQVETDLFAIVAGHLQQHRRSVLSVELQLRSQMVRQWRVYVCPVLTLNFDCLDLKRLGVFLVHRYVFGISRSDSHIKIIGQNQRHRSKNSL